MAFVRHIRWWWAVAAPIAFLALLLVSSPIEGDEAFQKAVAFDRGDAEADLIRAAGSPTRRVDDTQCQSAGGDHALDYTVDILRLWGLLGRQPSSSLVFCIGNDGTIMDRSYFDY